MKERIDVARARELIGRFAGKRFVVLGDIMLDRYVYGDVDRISPEAPVPVVRVRRTEERLGGAANVARNLAALGAKAALCGVIGTDEDGEALSRSVERRGMDPTLLVRAEDRPTTRKIRIIAHQQQVVRIDHERDDPLEPETEERLVRSVREGIRGAAGLLLSDYGKGVVGASILPAVMDAARSAGVPVFVDPKVKHFSLYRGASLVTPNLAEASLAAGEKIVDEPSLLRAGATLLELLPGTTVLLTRGADGMTLFEPGGAITHIGTTARKVFDVTGAGDTVIAVYALASAVGASGREAAILANHAAGLVVQESGAATVASGALEKALREG